jgi:uroporphyrin-3 C-methyltransferase
MSESATPPSTPSAEPVEPAQHTPAAEGTVREPAEPPSKTAVPLGLLAAFAVLVIAIAGWQWYDSRTQVATLKEELARRLADAEARNKDAVTTAHSSRESVREISSKVESLENGLAESQNQQVALEALYQQLSRHSDEWALAEIEQTLMIAAQQLQIAGNVKAAILALKNADLRLQRVDRPQLGPLRKVIERDIERLQVAPHVDVAGLSGKIDALLAAVDALPLAMQQRPPPQAPSVPAQEDANVFLRLAREMWADLRGLVRIQSVDKPDVPLLEPSQAFFLRENLKLRLLSARIALLQRDEKTYRADLQAVRQWLDRFYDTRDRNLAAISSALKQLSDVKIAVDVPDINASLNAVRDYKLTREKAGR